MSRTRIQVPASTSNLGASFDACGLALSLYITVTVEPSPGPHASSVPPAFEIETHGELTGRVPLDDSNLIIRVARALAERRGYELPAARVVIDSEIPLARGLGSSGSAIIAGISLYESLTGDALTESEIFEHALRFEEHPDNLAPALLGGLVVTCLVGPADGPRLAAVKRPWPEAVRIVLAVPDYEMETSRMRTALPAAVDREDAVFNVQRAAMLQALISELRFELLREALRDRLHQPFRSPLGPGLAEVLKLNDETGDYPGLLGVAISGAGPTIAAFVDDNDEDIASEMIGRFDRAGVSARSLQVEVDSVGRRVERG